MPFELESSDGGFCLGEGSVMANGFQSTVNGPCIKLLFQPWVLNTSVKYALGFVGCFLIAFANEALAKKRKIVWAKLLEARARRPDDQIHSIRSKAVLAGLYMAQMMFAYIAMLVAMTYESGLFAALLLGFGVGFLSFRSFVKDVTSEPGIWRFVDATTTKIHINGMKCKHSCGKAIKAALTSVQGVTNVFVVFDEKAAYVAGSAPTFALIETIEAVGYAVEDAELCAR